MNHNTTTTHAATASVPIIPPRQQREKVLIVCHADGWIEAFAEHHVDVRLETMPYGCGSVEGELMAEEWFERQLSRPFRNIFCPGLRIIAVGKKRYVLGQDWIEFLDQQPQETASGPTLPRATRCQKSNARPEE